MSARLRTAVPFAFALSLAPLVAASSARAQEAAVAPVATSTASAAVSADAAPVAAQSAATPAPAGPTMDAAAVAVRHLTSESTTAAAPRGGYGQSVALMVVGGVALLAGLIIGGPAGTAIAVGGAVVGIIGLYQYLQ